MTLITNIQRYSIHDGDGIRTTIFFKGCPLKCVWCHNPETQNYKKQVLYDEEKCADCKRCLQACPHHAISEKNGKMQTDLSLCSQCGECTDHCLLNLREIAGKEWTVKELVREVKKDEMFYEESGGGVTLSGGEVMTQDMDFIEELVRQLHREGISVTIDTCGFAPYDHFKRILPYVNTFLYDIKVMDEELHRRYIGVGNELILENLRKLSDNGARLYIRIPVIKEVNGDEKSMRDIIGYLKDFYIHAAQINLLAYHNTGSSKYSKLGKAYGGTELHAPTKEEMEALREIFIQEGYYHTKIGG